MAMAKGEDSGPLLRLVDEPKIVQDIASLYSNKKFYDVVLKVGNLNIPAHKAILSVRSEYFETLFKSEAGKQDEITISDVSEEAFRNLLQYIYTGAITVATDNQSSLDVLALARRFVVKDLESGLITELIPHIDKNNVFAIEHVAEEHNFPQLLDACHSFMEVIGPTVSLNKLSKTSLIKLLERDSFVAPEIEIFKCVAGWCEENDGGEDLVVRCVRLSLLSVDEIVSIVWVKNLVKPEHLMQAIAEVIGFKPKSSQLRARLIVDENIASPLYNAEVISGRNTSNLLTGNRDVANSAEIDIDGKNGFIIKLNNVWRLNHIKMRLFDDDARYYSYYIEFSLDRESWHRVIDYSIFACRSVQNLYFEPQIAQYINIVGTSNTANTRFHLVYVEAYFKSSVPEFISGIIRPDTNVATYEQEAKVIQGINPEILLNGDTKNYSSSKGFTAHMIRKGCIIVQLAQPYMLSSMKLLLWDGDDRRYKYFIETSVSKKSWKMVVDRRNEGCQSWQNLSFPERPVVFIKILGTENSANNSFHCVHFECPAQNGQVDEM